MVIDVYQPAITQFFLKFFLYWLLSAIHVSLRCFYWLVSIIGLSTDYAWYIEYNIKHSTMQQQYFTPSILEIYRQIFKLHDQSESAAQKLCYLFRFQFCCSRSFLSKISNRIPVTFCLRHFYLIEGKCDSTSKEHQFKRITSLKRKTKHEACVVSSRWSI